MKGIKRPKPTISAAQLKRYRKKHGIEEAKRGPRVFDGKKYSFYRGVISKLDKDISIKNLKKMGYRYRTVKERVGYSIYKRKL